MHCWVFFRLPLIAQLGSGGWAVAVSESNLLCALTGTVTAPRTVVVALRWRQSHGAIKAPLQRPRLCSRQSPRRRRRLWSNGGTRAPIRSGRASARCLRHPPGRNQGTACRRQSRSDCRSKDGHSRKLGVSPSHQSRNSNPCRMHQCRFGPSRGRQCRSDVSLLNRHRPYRRRQSEGRPEPVGRGRHER